MLSFALAYLLKNRFGSILASLFPVSMPLLNCHMKVTDMRAFETYCEIAAIFCDRFVTVFAYATGIELSEEGAN